MAYAWQCPFCGHHSTIGDRDYTRGQGTFHNGNKYGKRAIAWIAITCPNAECHEYVFRLSILEAIDDPQSGYKVGEPQHQWQLVPAAEMKVFPDYVPAAVLTNYKEACQIATLSPKASATLSRRCLQGMIRDFWSVKAGRLVDEIAAIHDRVDPDAWQAIEAVRSIGNIGAHMEADINVIVDVEPEEAKLLIGLIETLVEEWYIARHERKSRLAKLADLAKEKLLARKKSPEEPA